MGLPLPPADPEAGPDVTQTQDRARAEDRPQTVPAELEVTCATASGIVMGLQHRELPLHGVQFHPESVLTQGGHRLLANWLELCGDAGAVERSAGMAPLVHTA